MAQLVLDAATMQTSAAQRLTLLSRFSLAASIALVVASCAGRETTSLAGEITCGSLTCGEGQLCKTFEPHPNETLQYTCVTVSPGCAVFDCQSDERCSDCEICPACITDQCGYLTSVTERNLFCAGF